MELAALLATIVDDPALAGLEIKATSNRGLAGVQVAAVHHDSRAVARDSLFCCVPGEHADGHQFAPAAVAAGASALLVERSLDLGVPELRVRSSRAAMGPFAAAFHGRPSDRLAVVGVTGTNGKTTTAHLLKAILDRAGRPCGLIGTLTGARTTPEAPDLQAQLAGLVADGTEAVAMEVSSHALELHRVDGTRFAVAVFTNLSPEHLDFHGDLRSYFEAKARLFDPSRSRVGVVNVDDPYGRLLRDAARVPTFGFSLADAGDLEVTPHRSTFTWRGHRVRIGLAGRFNVANALAAATAADQLGVGPAVVAAGLEAAGPVAGRFELVDEGQRFVVVVDYAHTPDGLEQVLATAREMAGDRRVVVVFGAGGDKDRSKRPAMGAAAARGADVVYITSDNPRSEDPALIISEVHEGIGAPVDRGTVAEVIIEPDRRSAISAALSGADAGDIVVVAGKGHEVTQVIGDRTIAFDDRVVTRELLRRRRSGR